MLSISIVDANAGAPTDENFINEIASIVPRWLYWEIEQAGLTVVAPDEADVIFLCHTGAVDFTDDCRKRLKHYKIPHESARRTNHRPYVISGGAVDATPFTGLQTADAISVGEAYVFVRQVLDLIKAGGTVGELNDYVIAYPHAIARDQILDYRREDNRPWLLAATPEPIATPDDFVDWEMTAFIRSSPTAFHYIASKGCHLKCKFCATTYRQSYRVNPNQAQLEMAMKVAQKADSRLYLVTNDAAALPYFDKLPRNSGLASQSLTVKALRNPETLNAVLASYARAKGNKMLRLGVEGLSTRIRQAYGKPVSDAELIEILSKFMALGVNFQLFYICGSPYEADSDWESFRQFYIDLSDYCQRGMHFLKLTAFQAEPPTPLAYFVNGVDYYDRFLATYRWRHNNHSNSRLRIANTRAPERRIIALADALGITREIVARIIPYSGTLHLAPDIADARRMLSEVVAWPLSPDKRWHLGESYRKLMGGEIEAAVINAKPIALKRQALRGGLGLPT